MCFMTKVSGLKLWEAPEGTLNAYNEPENVWQLIIEFVQLCRTYTFQEHILSSSAVIMQLPSI